MDEKSSSLSMNIHTLQVSTVHALLITGKLLGICLFKLLYCKYNQYVVFFSKQHSVTLNIGYQKIHFKQSLSLNTNAEVRI